MFLIAGLIYAYDNFDALVTGQESQSKTYDELYAQYERAIEKGEEAYTRHSDFVLAYAKEHPDIVEYLKETKRRMQELGDAGKE